MVKNNILVTGATGQVGSNLVRELAKNKNNDITILIQENTWHPFLNGLKLNVIYGDIINKDNLKKALRRQKYVYHVAGIVSHNKFKNKIIYKTHVTGTKLILEECLKQKIKKIVVTASTAGIGIPKFKDVPLDENARFDFKNFRDNMYMYSKHMEIKLCSDFSKKGLNVCVVSPTTIYGEGDFGMHVGTLVKKIKSGEILFAPPGGNAVISVKDTIQGHILAMKKGKSGENYILANEFLTYLDLFNIIAKLLRVKKIEKVLPFWMLPPMKFFSLIVENVFGAKSPITSASTDFKFKFRYFDSSKAKRALGWKPKQSFENAMRESIQFYRKYKLL